MKSHAAGTVVALALAFALAAGQRSATGPEPQRGSLRLPRSVQQRAAEQFIEVSEQAGIRFVLTSGGFEKKYIIEAKGGGGIAWIDYDNDDDPDLFFVNGSTFEDWRRRTSPRSRLYRNNGDGTFADVYLDSGLDHTGWGMGVCAADFDNDGSTDLYVTYYGGNILYRNMGGGKFADVTKQAGVAGRGWGMGCAFGDYDNDGFLDLYVANYVDVDIEQLGEPGSAPNCTYRRIATFCGPRGLGGGRDVLYHNEGNRRFSDVTEKAGIDPGLYFGLGVVMGDYDRDGLLDIYVANDSTPSALYHNNGDGTFTDLGPQSGTAYSSEGQEQAGMGVEFGDYDNDGWLDLVKGNFSDDTRNLYHNDKDGTFTDQTYFAGLGDVAWLFTTFGAEFLDYDNDGWKDILLANGQTFPQMDRYPTGITYAERNMLFHNLRNGRFEEVGLRSGPGLALKKVSRGLATADYDNDGDLEFAVTNMNAAPDLIRRVRKNANNSILLKLAGTRSNCSGIGAKVRVTGGGLTQFDEVRSGGSYLSSPDSRLHFGLGPAVRVDRIEIEWPGGAAETIRDVTADQLLVIKEGSGVVRRKSFR
ncbi:MAG: CRTAC1 family protein [Acidobacteria bacterium]|nr:CRTAC1 family protein [Acidobacteriota bacterium]